MASEPFSRVLMGRELQFSGPNMLNPKDEDSILTVKRAVLASANLEIK